MTFIQTSKHTMNTKVMTPMLVSNGADQALPAMVTDTYAFKAKNDGKVIEVNDKYMIIEYKDKSRDFIDLTERVLKNSDGGFYITLHNKTDLKAGRTFKKGEVVAYDKSSFNREAGANDNLQYTGTTLMKVAIMNTDEGFEDSCIISDWVSEALASDVVVKESVVLDKNAIVYSMVKKDDKIIEGDPLIIFQNAFEDEDANNIIKNITDDEGNPITDIGRIKKRAKVTGKIQDINIYHTVDVDQLSDSLQKIVKSYEKEINDLKKIMKSNNINVPPDMKPTYTLEATGKLKAARDSVMIEFYQLYSDKMGVGDKLTFYSANKGVVKDIFPKGLEPYVDSMPEEKIHTFLSISSINGRMVTSPLTIGTLNRLMIELSRSCKRIYKKEIKPIEQILLPEYFK